MGGNKGRKGHGVRNFLVVVGCCGLAFMALYAFVPGFRSLIGLGGGGSTPGTTGTFSVTVRDPFNPTVTMDPLDFTCTLHMHKGVLAKTSAANWDTNALVTTVRDLTAAVFATARLSGYVDFWVTVSGSVANTVNTYNDLWGDRTYGARDFQLNADGANVLDMYVTPSGGAGFTIANLNTGAAITTANITAGTNFSVTQFLNNRSVGAYDQCYVAYTSYIQLTVDVNIVTTFTNATGVATTGFIELGDLVASNLSATGGAASRTIVYHTGFLGQAPITSNFIWGDDAVAAARARIVSPNSAGLVQKFGSAAI